MLCRQEPFANGEIYHIVNRGIDDKLIFKDVSDYYRGVFSIYEFNTTDSIKIRERRRQRAQFKKSYTRQTCVTEVGIIEPDKREKLVEVLAFCLMPNHFHLLLKQVRDGGITDFMRKVGTGYSKYFNTKYRRKGHLFQNKFADVLIKSDNQLQNVFVYIHTNPVALIESNWKEEGIKEPDKASKFLENYKWSSYQDYLNKRNFPSVSDRAFFLEVMGGANGCRESINNWVEYKGEIADFSSCVLE